MVEAWFECDFTTNENFKDSELLNEYCKYLNYEFETYKTLLCESLDEKLFDYEIFKEYKAEFEKLTDTKNRRDTKTYKALDDIAKEEIEKKELVKYIRAIEKEKLYYFCLAFKNRTDVIIVKAPNDNKESKKFLGYDWSTRKGKEGIKYLSSSNLQVDVESLDEDDKRVLENLSGLKNINTPLYNPNNSEDETKINKIIKDNFGSGTEVPSKAENKFSVPKELETYVKRAKLVDMLDFNRVEFNKAISLSVDKKVEIKSKYPLVKIETILEKINGNTTKIQKDEILDIGKYPVITQEQEKIISGYTDNKKTITDLPLVVFGDHSCTFKYIDFEFIRGADGTRLLKPNSNFNIKFFYYILQIVEIENKDKYERHMKYLNAVKIPLPPLEIQEKIINECQKVDDEVEKANIKIKNLKEDISNTINSINADMVKLEKVLLINSEIFDPTTKPNDSFIYVDIDSIGKGDGFISYENMILGKNAPSRARRVVKNDSVVISTVRPYLKGFAYVENQTLDCIFSTGFAVLEGTESLSSKYLFLLFMFSNNLMKQMEEAMPKSSYPSINKKDIENFKIPLPNLETQKQIVLKIEKFEDIINEAKKVIDSAKEKKEKILKNYL